MCFLFVPESAILDVVFNEVTQTFYILDIMSWKQHPMYDAEVSQGVSVNFTVSCLIVPLVNLVDSF